MKRIVVIVAILAFAAPLAFAELSPDRAHVKIARDLPRECLDQGSFETATTKYTCTKVDSSEVWNDVELRKFDKEIFEAFRQEVQRIGLVVRQDSTYTRSVPDQQKEVAYVERRDGTKYRYTHK